MAQWLGQFTELTHATKVQDLEASLRVAVESLRLVDSGDSRRKKAKAIYRLATRVMSARLKCLKARSAKRREETTREGSIDAILAEFGAQDISLI